MHDDDGDGYDQRPEPPRTIEECGKCHASAEPGTQSVISAGPSGAVTVFHTRECLDEFRREMSARADEGAQRDAVMRRGMAALRAHLRDHPPAGDAAPYAAVLAELVEQYLVADMRGRYVVHRDVFEVAGRHLAHVPGIDGTPAPLPDDAPEDLEPYTSPKTTPHSWRGYWTTAGRSPTTATSSSAPTRCTASSCPTARRSSSRPATAFSVAKAASIWPSPTTYDVHPSVVVTSADRGRRRLSGTDLRVAPTPCVASGRPPPPATGRRPHSRAVVT
ncbi:hypothetical protein [Embleya sp. NBC_00896]|uniref:hypothetical protein n=1 Tax=Embleya sp. NBC_00896 TaxID=2975961 RepID=UPI00386DADBC|nr:hypothetical protein OG928_00410 [Embleya sp. NBC_00896]